MALVHIFLEPEVVSFYSRLADAVGLPLEQVLSDALFKLAGELSLQALQKCLKNPLSGCNTSRYDRGVRRNASLRFCSTKRFLRIM